MPRKSNKAPVDPAELEVSVGDVTSRILPDAVPTNQDGTVKQDGDIETDQAEKIGALNEESAAHNKATARIINKKLSGKDNVAWNEKNAIHLFDNIRETWQPTLIYCYVERIEPRPELTYEPVCMATFPTAAEFYRYVREVIHGMCAQDGKYLVRYKEGARAERGRGWIQIPGYKSNDRPQPQQIVGGQPGAPPGWPPGAPVPPYMMPQGPYGAPFSSYGGYPPPGYPPPGYPPPYGYPQQPPPRPPQEPPPQAPPQAAPPPAPAPAAPPAPVPTMQQGMMGYAMPIPIPQQSPSPQPTVDPSLAYSLGSSFTSQAHMQRKIEELEQSIRTRDEQINQLITAVRNPPPPPAPAPAPQYPPQQQQYAQQPPNGYAQPPGVYGQQQPQQPYPQQPPPNAYGQQQQQQQPYAQPYYPQQQSQQPMQPPPFGAPTPLASHVASQVPAAPVDPVRTFEQALDTSVNVIQRTATAANKLRGIASQFASDGVGEEVVDAAAAGVAAPSPDDGMPYGKMDIGNGLQAVINKKTGKIENGATFFANLGPLTQLAQAALTVVKEVNQAQANKQQRALEEQRQMQQRQLPPAAPSQPIVVQQPQAQPVEAAPQPFVPPNGFIQSRLGGMR